MTTIWVALITGLSGLMGAATGSAATLYGSIVLARREAEIEKEKRAREVLQDRQAKREAFLRLCRQANATLRYWEQRDPSTFSGDERGEVKASGHSYQLELSQALATIEVRDTEAVVKACQKLEAYIGRGLDGAYQTFAPGVVEEDLWQFGILDGAINECAAVIRNADNNG